MSILWDALKKKITWATAASEIEDWGKKLIARNPTAQQFVAASVQAVKQGASNMIGLADTALANHLGDVMIASHTAADAALLSLSGGKAAPAIPLAEGTIDQIEQAGAAAFHAWALQAKAALLPVAPAPSGSTGQSAPSAGVLTGGAAAPVNGG